MAFLKLFSEVTGGTVIGIMLLILFVVIFIYTAFFIVKKYKTLVSTTKLSMGLLIHLVISVSITNILLSLLLFPHGEYFNYGLGEGLMKLLFSVISGLLISFLIIKLVYFKLVK